MDLTGDDETGDVAAELAAIADPLSGDGLCPLEDPGVKPITEEMLIAPHPSEPGVDGVGGACPPENPGHPEISRAGGVIRRSRLR